METLEEKNRMIAEFMGMVESSIDGQFWTEKSDKGFGIGELVGLKYHSSWDWLMPVVEKIETLGYNVDVDRNCCAIRDASILIQDSCLNKKDTVYHTVIQFIEWYNKNK